MESSDHCCFIFWTRLKKHIALAAVDCRHIVVLPLTVRVLFSCAIGSCGCCPVSYQPVLVPWILLRLLITSRPCIIDDFNLWWLKQFARPSRFSSHHFNRSTWVHNFLGTILHRILVLICNVFMESIYWIISLRLCRHEIDNFNRLCPSWLQQSVQNCLLLQQLCCNITSQRADRTSSYCCRHFKFSVQCPKGEWTTRRRRDEDGEEGWQKRCKNIQVWRKFPSQQVQIPNCNSSHSLTWTRRRPRGTIKTYVLLNCYSA